MRNLTANPIRRSANRSAARGSRRFAVAAAGILAGTAVLAAIPVAATAGTPVGLPECRLDTNTHVVTYNANGYKGPIRILSEFDNVSYDTGMGFTLPCGRDSFTFANGHNTDKVVINGDPATHETISIENYNQFGPGFSKDTDAPNLAPEMEFVVDSGAGDDLTVSGIPAGAQVGTGTGPLAGPALTIRTGNSPFGNNPYLGLDTGQDITSLGRPHKVTLNGLDGDNVFTGTAQYPNLAATSVPLELNTAGGNDVIQGGLAIRDVIHAGAGFDSISSVDGAAPDFVDAGPDFDTVVTDNGDAVSGGEKVTKGSVGKLLIKRPSLRATAGKTTLVRFAWNSPKAWKDIKQLKVQLMVDGDQRLRRLGQVTMVPATEAVTSTGQGFVESADLRVSHEGRSVVVQLPVNLPKSVAGAPVAVSVEATSAAGAKQTEPSAATINVAK